MEIGTRDIAKQLQEMRPGQCLRLSASVLKDLSHGMFENPYGFDKRDFVLEHIVGSSYEYGWREDHGTGDTIYFRLKKPLSNGERSYVSPDRRDRYERGFDGIYRRTGEQP